MEKNYRCPGCGVTMEFDPATQKLHCGFCESYYTVEEIEISLAPDRQGKKMRGVVGSVFRV